MAGEIVVPSLGESVSEATVAKWFKKVGDAVEADEPIVELETDKVTLEVNAPAAGKLSEIKMNEDDTGEVGAVLGVIEVGAKGNKGSAASSQDSGKKEDSPVTSHQSPATTAAQPQSGPAARKLMDEKGLKPSDISGTGKDGRVTKGDVLAAPATSHQSLATAPQGAREERVKMSKLRQVIARRLKESQNTAAILTTFNEIDMSALKAIRN